MATSKETLKDRLSRYREIKISVIGRKSGERISIPVWFVLEGKKLHLLPVAGSESQWYKNVRKNPSISIDARGVEGVSGCAGDRREGGQICGRAISGEIWS